MSKDRFDFKYFSIYQGSCGMKVGTDGVLLGSWAKITDGDNSNNTENMIANDSHQRILDIGTGTGLIALMMAQRYPGAEIDAIDIDEDACNTAQENVDNCRFNNSIIVKRCSFQEYVELLDKEGKLCYYDGIVSNPPFFEKSLKNPNEKKSVARHTDTLPFTELIKGVTKLLMEWGVFSVILPLEVVEQFVAECYLSGLYLSCKCSIKTVEHKDPKRFLLSFTKHHHSKVKSTTELLMNAEGNRSDWYKKITDDFYL